MTKKQIDISRIAKNCIVDIATARFPIGTIAFHRNYGVCKVIAAIGAARMIATPLRGSAKPVMARYKVHVSTLQRLPTET